MISWLVLKLEISYIELEYLEGFWFLFFYFFKDILKIIFFHIILSFHSSSFAFRYFLNVNDNATL